MSSAAKMAEKTWEGPIELDKSPFSSVGNCSNRMTELPDGTILWPQRLGYHVAEWEKRRNELENSGQPLTAADFSNSLRFSGRQTEATLGAIEHLCRIGLFETTLMRLHSGRLIAAIRYQPLIDLDTPLSKFGKRRIPRRFGGQWADVGQFSARQTDTRRGISPSTRGVPRRTVSAI